MTQNCPKCTRLARPGEAACARCGLLRERWSTYDGRPPPHPILDPLWAAAEGDWENPKRHAAMEAAVAASWQDLSALAQRYSVVLRERPQDGVAAAALDHLIKVAMKIPLPNAADTAAAVTVGQTAKVVLSFVLMLLAGYLAYKILHARA